MKESRERAGHFWRRRLVCQISEQGVAFETERHTSLVRLFSQSIMLVHTVQGDFLESQSIACEVTQVVPPHGVDICLSNLIGELGMMFGKEKIEVLEINESSLLNDLCIDVWRT